MGAETLVSLTKNISSSPRETILCYNIYLVFIEKGDNIIDHQCVVCCVLYYRNMTLKTRTMGMLHVYLSSLLI